MKINRRQALSLIGAGTLFPVCRADAAPAAEPWPRWQAHEPASRRVVDHGAWQAFLDRFLVLMPGGPNRVRYGAVDDDGHKTLDAAIAAYARLPMSLLNRSEQQAAWINLYNALTVRVVLAHYPVATIRDIDISPGWFTNGPWGAKLVTVENVPLSLDDIEHRILRPLWRDARVHYAVNCAALGCPSLQAEAFTGARTERMLQAGASEFVARPHGVRFEADALVVSSIYRWFADDFGGWPTGVLNHLATHAAPELAARLAVRTDIDDHGYDWALNGTV